MLKTNRRAGPQEWEGVVSGVDDPFIRAVLRRIGGEGWDTVLGSAGEDGMGVGDRLSIAVCNLGDREVRFTWPRCTISAHRSEGTAYSTAIRVPPLTLHLPYRKTTIPLTSIRSDSSSSPISSPIPIPDRRRSDGIPDISHD